MTPASFYEFNDLSLSANVVIVLLSLGLARSFFIGVVENKSKQLVECHQCYLTLFVEFGLIWEIEK